MLISFFFSEAFKTYVSARDTKKINVKYNW